MLEVHKCSFGYSECICIVAKAEEPIRAGYPVSFSFNKFGYVCPTPPTNEKISAIVVGVSEYDQLEIGGKVLVVTHGLCRNVLKDAKPNEKYYLSRKFGGCAGLLTSDYSLEYELAPGGPVCNYTYIGQSASSTDLFVNILHAYSR